MALCFLKGKQFSVSLSVCLPVSVCLFICLFVCLSLSLSLSLCVSLSTQVVIQETGIVLSSSNIKSYSVMTLQGLEYLHLNWILHRVSSSCVSANCILSFCFIQFYPQTSTSKQQTVLQTSSGSKQQQQQQARDGCLGGGEWTLFHD